MKIRLLRDVTVSALILGLGTSAFAEGVEKGTVADTEFKGNSFVEVMRKSKGTIPLVKSDPTAEAWKENRDFSEDGRKPGLIQVQRQHGGLAYTGIPTFFKAPIALTPEDLKAGKVDVAFMGASVDTSVGRRGTAFGPQAFRTSEIYVPWGKGFHKSSEHTLIDPLEELVIADYSDAPVDLLSLERSIVPVHDMVKEIAETGTIPAIIGGDHSLMYPNVSAITDVYGKGNVGVIHFDAHIDAEEGGFGHYLSHGSPVRRLIEEGHVPGKNYIQIGLRGWLTGTAMTKWMRDHEMKYHFMAEVEKRGWDAVMKDVYQEVSDGPEYVYLSIDMDGFDPAFAPGAGTPEPGGLTPREMFPILRSICAIKQCVGFDIVELNPLVDVGNATSLLANRVAREILNGIAMRKKGITEPGYLHPDLVKHK